MSVVNTLLLEQEPRLRTLHTACLVDRKKKGFLILTQGLMLHNFSRDKDLYKTQNLTVYLQG